MKLGVRDFSIQWLFCYNTTVSALLDLLDESGWTRPGGWQIGFSSLLLVQIAMSSAILCLLSSGFPYMPYRVSLSFINSSLLVLQIFFFILVIKKVARLFLFEVIFLLYGSNQRFTLENNFRCWWCFRFSQLIPTAVHSVFPLTSGCSGSSGLNAPFCIY